eukprot:gene17549-9179_t
MFILNLVFRNLAERKQTVAEIEESRRQKVLAARRKRQLEATNKFQRSPVSKSKRTEDGPDSHTLQDGLYNVRGHVVEIKNGTRVPSAEIHAKGIPMRSNSGTHDRKTNDSPANYDYRAKNSIYSGKESLLRHLSGLAHQTVGLKGEDEKDSVPQVENGLLASRTLTVKTLTVNGMAADKQAWLALP